jgi:hypothetical protein
LQRPSHLVHFTMSLIEPLQRIVAFSLRIGHFAL